MVKLRYFKHYIIIKIGDIISKVFGGMAEEPDYIDMSG